MKRMMLSFCIVLGVALVALADVAPSSSAPFVLAERGKKGLDIQLMTPDSPSAKYAAQELSDYVFKLTGVRMQVTTEPRSKAVRIREVKTNQENAFAIQMTPQGLEICGGKRGVLYGVYDLLERFGGVGWYASWHEVVPTLDKFEVPGNVDIKEKPAIEVRDDIWHDSTCWQPGPGRVFAARLRLNGFVASPEERMGGDSNRFGGGLGNCHTLNLLVPEELYETHPEYFSLIDGKRVKKSQRCLTNPDVLALAISNVLARIAKDPGARFYGVSQNDSWGEHPDYCRCENCAAVDAEEGTHAGTYVRFVNAIADAVKEKYPDKIVETLAYRFTRHPPQKTRLRDNVMPCFCTIEDDFSTPISKSTYKEDIETLKDLQGWAKMTSKLYIWDYTVNFAHYLRPFPNVDALQDNLRLFRDSGAISVYEQGAYEGFHGAFAELKAWLLAKWMWNPELDKEVLLAKFFNGYYGKAAPFVRAYFDELQARQAEWSQGGKRPLRIYEDLTNSVTEAEFQVRGLRLWREAMEAVKGEPPVYKHNVEMSMLSTAYTILRWSLGFVSLAQKDDLSAKYGVNRVALAKWLIQTLKNDPYGHQVRFAETKDGSDRILHQLEGAASGSLSVSGDEVTIPASYMASAQFKLVDDPTAMNGKAGRMDNTHYEWSAYFPMESIILDKDTDYTLSIHVKVNKKAGGPYEKGTYAFWTGIYDYNTRKDVFMVYKTVDNCSGDWQWVDVGTWKPIAGQSLWLGPGPFNKAKYKTNPCHDGVLVDAIRLRHGK